jgi:hypothetical protein
MTETKQRHALEKHDKDLAIVHALKPHMPLGFGRSGVGRGREVGSDAEILAGP